MNQVRQEAAVQNARQLVEVRPRISLVYTLSPIAASIYDV